MKFTKKLVKSLFLILGVSIIYGGGAYAQTVSGTVINSQTGDPLPGVNIVVKGTSNGTATNSNGHYSLEVSSLQNTLVFSFIGYKTKTVPINGRMKIDVALELTTITGKELVVIGFGTMQEKSEVTGAISSVSQENFNVGVTTSPGQLIQGKISGVQVTQRSGNPNASTVVNIRGVGTLRANSHPLYIIDGVPVTGSADFLNPDNIKSVTVLKDASATAIYGSRASAGVILITTKKGSSRGEPVLTYSGQLSISSPANTLDLLTADQFRKFQKKYGDPDDDIYSNTVSTDWQDVIFRTAISQNQSISYAGGSENNTYRASIGYEDNRGIVYDSRRRNYNASLSLGQSVLNDRIQLDMQLRGIFINAENPSISNDAGVGGDLISRATSANPTYPAFTDDGKIFNFPKGINPLLFRKRTIKFNKKTRLRGYIKANVRIIEGLQYTVTFSANKLNVNGVDLLNPISAGRGAVDIPDPQGRLETSILNNYSVSIENNLKYNFLIDKNSFNLLGGYSYRKFKYQSRQWSINNFSTGEILSYRNPSIGTSLTINENRPNGTAHITYLQSVYGRMMYNYDDTYFLTAAIRVDGSSKFGKNKKYGFFPSVSVGWLLSNESFLAFEALSNLKLRVGWGRTGNQNIPTNITRRLVNVSTGQGIGYFFSGKNIPGISLIRAQNKLLHWETSTQTNIGLDFGFLNNRITGTIDIFRKVSSSILFKSSTSLDPIQITDVFWKNYDEMKITNEGLEVSLNYIQQIGANFSFEIGGNISFINNNVTGAPQRLATGTISGRGLSGITVGAVLNNHPVGTFYLRKWIGFDENGLSQYKDVNKDGVINSDDLITAGSALPSSTYGIHLRLNYNSFVLSMSFNGQNGNKLFWNDHIAYYAYPRAAGGGNTLEFISNFGGEESIKDSPKPSTRYIYDASFFRLNSVTLGYSISSGPNSDWFKNIRFTVSGQNIFVITDYPGYDPNVQTKRVTGGLQSLGIDGTSYPRARTFTFGIEISI